MGTALVLVGGTVLGYLLRMGWERFIRVKKREAEDILNQAFNAGLQDALVCGYSKNPVPGGPQNWWCSRSYGHEGPCALHPPDEKPVR